MDDGRLDVDAVEWPAFGLSEDHPPFSGEAHRHRRSQLLYTAAGTLHLYVDDRRWLLPPQRAAWLGAGVVHRVDAPDPVALRTVYFEPGLGGPEAACSVFAVDALARELILLAMRWGPKTAHDALATHVFGTLAGLSAEWAADPLPWHLPTARSPELQRAIDFTLAHLDEPLPQPKVARVAGLSTRSLNRRFAEETDTTWRRFLHTARMLRAMELLARRDAQVSAVALAVGYDSFSAFSHAFRRFTGVSCRAFQAG